MKKFLATVGLVSFLAPLSASAQTVTVPPPVNTVIPGQSQTTASPAQSPDSLLDQAQALLQQVQSMQSQLGVSPTSGASAPSAAAACPAITGTLGPGSSGAAVVQLQEFLAANPSLYPSGLVTGYYGSLTEAAVEAFQAQEGIVSSGSPSTTGYGQVGPKTAAAIEAQCGGSGNGTTAASGPVGGFIQVSPTGGPAPLAVTIEATVNVTDSCASALYTLDFGDESQQEQLPVGANTCQAESQTFEHTYTTAGTYEITLSTGTHQSQAAVVVQ